MSVFDGLPFPDFGGEETDDLLDVSNNYLPQPFTHEADSNCSIFDPDNNLVPPHSEFEDMPLEIPVELQNQVSVSQSNVQSLVSFQEPMFSTINPAITSTKLYRNEEFFTIPNEMGEIKKRQPLGNLPTNVPLSPKTPQKESSLLDPLTPTANLKILMSAASPEIRNRDSMRKLLKEGIKVQQVNRRENNQEEVNRKDKSLGLLCQRFLALFPEYPVKGTAVEVGLNAASRELGVERRRIYDIVNVLESVEMLKRVGKNRYVWYGKTSQPDTLRALKVKAINEGYPALLERARTNTMQQPLQSQLLSSDEQDVSSSKANLKHAKAGLRKDKSLGLISQKFLMLFLVSENEVLTLELAARVLTDDSDLGTNGIAKFKTKIRRLYDVANIFISLNLIEKVYSTSLKGKKAGFTYVGPRLHQETGQRRRSLVRHSSFDLICRAASEERERLYSNHPTTPVTAKTHGNNDQPMSMINLKNKNNERPRFNFDHLTTTELVITEIKPQQSFTKRRGPHLNSEAKKVRQEAEAVTKLMKGPILVKTTPIRSVSPRALHFESCQDVTSGRWVLQDSTPFVSITSVVSGPAKNAQYMTPDRDFGEKDISPVAKTKLFSP